METFHFFLLLSYASTVVLCGGLIIYLRVNRHEAFKGDTSAARKIILPAFEPLLWIMAIPSVLSLVGFSIILGGHINFAKVPIWLSECFNSGRYFVLLIVPVLMLQKSISFPALRRAVCITLLLSTYMIPLDWAARKIKAQRLSHGDERILSSIIMAARLAVLLLYVYVMVKPPARASKQTLREYCLYACIYHGMLMVSKQLAEDRKRHKGQYELMYVAMVWALLGPIVVWRVLKADTEHWRGWGQTTCALQRHKSTSITERISSDGLHVLIEMHRNHIIDFASLKFKQRIGLGASSTIYQGILHSKIAVAVKVYTPKEFSDQLVSNFSHEAALCGSLHHPNIVKFYGMCVCPPTISLVSELCQGSLDHVTMIMANSYDRFLMRTGSTTDKREHLLINLGFMLDAARSIAHLHSFSPAFVHRDIKPSNFLVDFENNVKLTDFGESRCLPRSPTDTIVNIKGATDKLDGDKDPASPTTQTSASWSRMRSSSLTTPSSDFQQLACDLTVKGTVDYMAPELIQGRAGVASYGEAADIYSLGVTFWDILHPGQEKFPHLKSNHLHIFEAILDGERPKFDYANTQRDADLHHVIELAWQTEPHLRPSAQHLVMLLERIQEKECARFAGELSYDIVAQQDDSTCAASRRHSSQSSESGFNARTQSINTTGRDAVATMLKLQAVHSGREAVRMGNMLMDAGVLHHLRHARPFESGSNNVYYFDQNCIQLYEPPSISILEDTHGGDSLDGTREIGPSHATNSSLLLSGAPTNQHAQHPRVLGTRPCADSTAVLSDCPARPCRCRALSQRLEQPKISVHQKFLQKIKGPTTSTPLLVDQALTANLLFASGDDDDNDEDTSLQFARRW